MLSDFRTQWNHAVLSVTKGFALPSSLQQQRGIPFYYPVALLFGASEATYVTANVVVTTLTGAMTIWISRRFYGWRGATRTSLLLIFAYEPYLANNITSHDTIGAFGLLLFLFLFAEFHYWEVKTRRSVGVIVAFAVAAALVIAWTNMQRGTGLFCMGVLAVYGISALLPSTPSRVSRSAFAVLALILTVVTMVQLERTGLLVQIRPADPASVEMNLLAFSGYDGRGRWADKMIICQAACNMEDEYVARLGKSMFLETLRTDPVAKYANYLVTTDQLLDVGHSLRWYLKTNEPGRYLPVDFVRDTYNKIRWLVAPVLLGLLILASLSLMKTPHRIFDPRMAPFLVIGAHIFVMGALYENQPRYSYAVFFLAAIYAGAPWRDYLVDESGSVRNSVRAWVGSWRAILRSIVSYGIVIASLVIVHRIATAVHGVTLVNLHHYVLSVRGEALLGIEEATRRFGVVPGQNTLRVGRPAPGEDARSLIFSYYLVARPGRESTLRYVIGLHRWRPINPPEGASLRTPGRLMQLLIDGEVRSEVDLSKPFDGQHITVDKLEAGPHQIELVFQFAEHQTHSDDVKTRVSYLGLY